MLRRIAAVGGALLSVTMVCLWLALWPGKVVWASEAEAEELVRATTEEVLATLRAERPRLEAEPRRVYDLVNEIIVPHFDFETMSRWVLGKHWRSATPQQRSRFVGEFRTLVVRTYSTSLLEYEDQEVRVVGARQSEGGDRVSVQMEVARASGEAIPIRYKMHKHADRWKVYDVLINGVSLVTNYRASFDSEIRERGIDGLLQRLAARNRPERG
jgi:phospholipid transport system substrate-binding protein